MVNFLNETLHDLISDILATSNTSNSYVHSEEDDDNAVTIATPPSETSEETKESFITSRIPNYTNIIKRFESRSKELLLSSKKKMYNAIESIHNKENEHKNMPGGIQDVLE